MRKVNMLHTLVITGDLRALARGCVPMKNCQKRTTISVEREDASQIAEDFERIGHTIVGISSVRVEKLRIRSADTVRLCRTATLVRLFASDFDKCWKELERHFQTSGKQVMQSRIDLGEPLLSVVPVLHKLWAAGEAEHQGRIWRRITTPDK